MGENPAHTGEAPESRATGAPPWWSAERHAERRQRLHTRARMVRALRHFFEVLGFIEVEPAALQVSPGNETHLHAFGVSGALVGTVPLYLHTSPEFAMKKLLAAGEERIVAFSRVFRDREVSPLHHAEFTMLEWYRKGEPYEALMDDCGAILSLAAEAAGSVVWRFRGREADPRQAPERLSVEEAFARHADLALADFLPADGSPDMQPFVAPFAEALRARGLRTADDDTWSDLFSRVISERIEPNLGLGRATILYDYPASEAALARRKAADPRFCERFELYVCGVELANAFGELTDPEEQRRRFTADMDEKMRIYGERYPLDEEFLSALAAMPEASGIALGLDRLVMLAAGAERVDEVIWTPLAAQATDAGA